MMFYLDQEEQTEKEAAVRREIKKKIALVSDHSLAETMTKGFISHFSEEMYEDIEGERRGSAALELGEGREGGVTSTRRKNKVKALPQLSPIAQTMSTIVFQNLHQQPSHTQDQLQPKKAMKSKQIIPYFSQTHSSPSSSDPSPPKPVQQPPSNHSSKPSKLFEFKEKERLLFEAEQDSRGTEHSRSEEFIALPEHRLVIECFESESEPEEEAQKERKAVQAPPKKKARISKNMGFINNSSLVQLKRDLWKRVDEDSLMQLILNRNREGFNRFWPEFSLHFEQQPSPLLFAKKISSQPSTTYILSASPDNFEQNSDFYLGKLKSSILGDIINLYGPGLNPSDAKEQNKIPRQLLATIVYAKLSTNKPREFQVFMKRPEYRYYLNFHQIAMYEQQLPLNELYKFPENREKIEKYCNKKPTYSKERQTYTLNFHGKAECSSIKNFILEKEEGGADLMMFGKINEGKFNIEIAHPLSFLIGFAVALTTFDSRLLLGS